MADLTFADSYNMVAYLEKSQANVDFAETVDFLNASPIRYALTVSPTIYVSYIEQFWSTVKTKIVNNETQIRAKVKPKTIVITESSVRRDLYFDDEDVVFNDEYDTPSHTRKMRLSMRRGGQVERAALLLLLRCQSRKVTPSYDSPILGVNTLGSDEERIKLKELMDMCTKLSDRVLDLKNVKDAQALEIKKLKKRGRNSDNIEELNVTEDEHMFELSDLAGTEVVLEEEPIALVEDKSSAEKGVSAAKDKDSTANPVTTACETVTTGSVNLDDVTLAETLMAIRSTKDKGKGIMQEPEKPVKVKGKDQIEYDADVAQRLQAELDEEARLEREREEEASNAALIEEWDSIEARIDADA
ncbi:hypothetical protein Tco_0922314 [Tanacetum coccineum]|uniref:Xylulose kinase-1 n=1 Tax=Tanacetum coccineum TaxID=301880 RepID=A0ABQ5CXR9_9ASTR